MENILLKTRFCTEDEAYVLEELAEDPLGLDEEEQLAALPLHQAGRQVLNRHLHEILDLFSPVDVAESEITTASLGST